MSNKNLKRIKEIQEQIDSLVAAKQAANEKIESLQAELRRLDSSPILYLKRLQKEIVKIEETQVLEFRKAA